MGRTEKLLERLRSRPTDFTYEEVVRVLGYLGFSEVPTGGGSRVRFQHADGRQFRMHKPHPGSIVKRYVVEELIDLVDECERER